MISISSSARLTQSQDGGVLLDIERGAMFTLNPVAARIVELLARERSVQALVAEISREFAVSEEIVKGDVQEFLSLLWQLDLVKDG
jgi:hypothetical protein